MIGRFWIFLFGLLLVATAPQDVHARKNCSFQSKGFATLDDGTVLRVLRCLVNELDRAKRENTALKKRLSEVEAVMTQLPSTYSNVDGEVTREEGRVIGRANFVLSARSTGGASSMPLAQDVLTELCSQTGGCSATMSFRQISVFDADAKTDKLVGPCQFIYDDQSGDWSVGSGCGSDPMSGVDGDERAVADRASNPVIASSAGACILSESEPGRAVGQGTAFARDYSLGLFLVSMPAAQPDGIRRFECELVLE